MLTPSGIWVLEVKWSMTPAEELDRVWGLPGHLEQTRQAARKVSGLVRSAARGVPVHPVLVLSGPGMPAVSGQSVREGVRVVNSTSRKGWEALLAQGETVWTLSQVRQAADVLVRLRDTRVTYEQRRARTTWARRGAALT